MNESPLFWPAELKEDGLYVLDETRIPQAQAYVRVTSTDEAVAVIRQMKTRAFGQFLVVLSTFLLELRRGEGDLVERVKATAVALNASRPTFPFGEVTGMVVGWAEKAKAEGQDVRAVLEKYIQGYLAGIRGKRLERVWKIADLLKDQDSVLTHCNVSGELAMAASIAREEGRQVEFFATETRPYMQGSRLTCWELNRIGADVTLVADNAVATLMAEGKVNKVIVGSDRNCANGDFANKIGTYQIAILAEEFEIPFYVLTQPSTGLKSADEIPIEIRPEEELLYFGGRRIVPDRVKGFYPGFDVIPGRLVTGAIPIDVTGSAR